MQRVSVAKLRGVSKLTFDAQLAAIFGDKLKKKKLGDC